MAVSWRKPPYLMHAAAASALSNGPWIPQTPDSYREPDIEEERQEGDEED